MRAMLIETELTPNPATRKFMPGRVVMEVGSRDFASAEAADASPLATALFELGDVTGVHFGSNPEPASLDVTLSGAPDLVARFPGLAESPTPTETESSVRYRVDSNAIGSTLVMSVLRGNVPVGEEQLRLERTTCRALSVGK